MTAEEIIKTRDNLKGARSNLVEHWEELAELYMPFRKMSPSGVPELNSAEDIFDTTARRAALILANGLASLVTPREELWFEYQPPRSLRNDDAAVRFYRLASETARELLEASNFYEEIQECYIESPVFGTTALFIGDMDDQGLYFLNQPIQTYYISEDHRHRVNCIYRDLTLTPDQAAGEFGKENLPKEILDKVGTPAGMTEPFEFIHAVYPRKERNMKAKDGKNKAFASITVCCKTKQIVVESGFEELPFAVHRYRRHGRCPWGFGPGAVAKGDPRQVNFLNQMIDSATEKAVFPPVIAPAGMEGEIGLGAMEITYIDTTDPNSAGILREWAASGRIDYAQARLEDKRSQINQAFHVDLFQMFANRQSAGQSPLSATEASMVNNEKLSQFSPVFGRLVSEMLDPILTRIFGMMVRNDLLDTPPPSVLGLLEGGERQGIAMPAVLYKNRIMLAMQARQNGTLMEYMQLAGPMLQAYPDGIDVLNFPQIFRDTSRNAGLTEDWINSKEVVKATQEARAAAQQQAAQMQQAEAAANVANKLGNTPPEARKELGLG